MAIHFFPKVGGRVDFDTPEEAARFFEITGGGTIEAPPPKAQTAKVSAQAPDVGLPAPKVRAKRKTSSLKQRLEDSIQIVMNSQEVTAPYLYEKLNEKGWLPDSKDPLNYIRYTLSSNKVTFKSEKRGHYHLDPSNPYAIGDHEAPIEGHVNPKVAKAPKAAPAEIAPVVEEVVEPPVVIEPPELEEVASTPVIQEPVVEPPPVVIETPVPDDTESLVAQLSQESVEPPVVVQAPPVTTKPLPVIRAAPPQPSVKLVEIPRIPESDDPVLDILNEFSEVLDV